ncbi:hypothetical protein GCM10023189_59080 [Nibrella saemangeumensis]|uniref:DUF6371 domain-containing protein n=2 Tax=Nibrella saemangeumensis TaxID=1084526 RepID=A0ABP8NS40_9BACT
MSYADEVREQDRQEWKSRQPIRPTLRSPKASAAPNPPKVAASAKPAQPICSFPDEVYRQTLTAYHRNNFARLLWQQFGIGAGNELLERFRVGTLSRWPYTGEAGGTIFWIVDEQGKARGGELKLFGPDGHTLDKSWVHTALTQKYKKNRQPVPDWLTDYSNNAPKCPFPFGLHQLATEPTDKPVAIVEACKTAVLCSGYFPAFIWMATVGLSYLKEERLQPLKSRSIVLYPDASTTGNAYQTWSRKAEELRAVGYKISVSDYLEKRATPEEKAAGYDLADYLLKRGRGYPPEWDNLPDQQPTHRLIISPRLRELAPALAEWLGIDIDEVKLWGFAPIL